MEQDAHNYTHGVLSILLLNADVAGLVWLAEGGRIVTGQDGRAI